MTLGARSASPAATTRMASTRRFGGDVLEEEPAGAGLEGAEDVLVEVEGREDDDPHAGERRIGGDAAGRLDAVESGHANVHQEDVGPVPSGELDGRVTVGGLPDELEVIGVVDEGAEAGAYEWLVVGDGDPDHDGSPEGRWAATRKPPPGRSPVSRVPP